MITIANYDKYIQIYIKMIKNSKRAAELRDIINNIYNEGIIDGEQIKKEAWPCNPTLDKGDRRIYIEKLPKKFTKKSYREFLNKTLPQKEVTERKCGGMRRPIKRGYGDYLYSQDREMFNENYKFDDNKYEKTMEYKLKFHASALLMSYLMHEVDAFIKPIEGGWGVYADKVSYKKWGRMR